MWLFNPCAPSAGKLKLQEVDEVPPRNGAGVKQYYQMVALPTVFRFEIPGDHKVAIKFPETAGSWVLPRYYPYSEFVHRSLDFTGRANRFDGYTYRLIDTPQFLTYGLLYLETRPTIPDYLGDAADYFDFQLTIDGVTFSDGPTLSRATLLQHLRERNRQITPLRDETLTVVLGVANPDYPATSTVAMFEFTVQFRVLWFRSPRPLTLDQTVTQNGPLETTIGGPVVHYSGDAQSSRWVQDDGWCLRWWLPDNAPTQVSQYAPVLMWKDQAVFAPKRWQAESPSPGIFDPYRPNRMVGNGTTVLPVYQADSSVATGFDLSLDVDVDLGEIDLLPGWP